jgi:hypothetical protein
MSLSRRYDKKLKIKFLLACDKHSVYNVCYQGADLYQGSISLSSITSKFTVLENAARMSAYDSFDLNLFHRYTCCRLLRTNLSDLVRYLILLSV